MNTMIRIAFLTALVAMVASCEFFTENDLLEDVKKDPPVAGADTDATDKDDVIPDVDNAATCGNGEVAGTEECDSSSGTAILPCDQLDSNQYSGGTANCSANCMWDRSGCILKNCGDGTVQPATEECDVSITEGTPCNQIDPQAYSSGMATCADNCKWDLSACVSVGCGDGTVGANEDCEGDMDIDCVDLDSTKQGIAVCDAETCKWDTTQCVAKDKCGNNQIDTGETCDGGAKPCIQVDPGTWISGDAYCNSTCNGWDTDACEPKSDCACGNGTVDTTAKGCPTDEGCETTQTTDCEALGYGANGIAVNCKTDCTGWDTSVCDQVQVAFNFDTPFIIDASRLGETAYMDAHGNAIMTGTFYGNWGNNEDIPPTGSSSQGYVARSVDTPTGPSLIMQENYFDGGMNPETPSAITLNFPTDDLTAGGTLGLPLTLQIGLSENSVKLFAYEPDASGFCLKYVATNGSFKITEAENTTATDGGTLAAWTEGQYIPLVPAATQATGTSLQQGYTFSRVCGAQGCGDGIINGTIEQCDISATTSFDCAKISTAYIGGTATCNQGTCQWNFANCQAAPFCGDNNTDAGEICDDGNTTPGDGCSSNCKFIDNNCTAITAGAFSAQIGPSGASGDMAMFVAEFTPTEGSGSLPELFFFYIDTDFIPVKSQAYSITEAVKSDYGLQAMTDYDAMNGTQNKAFAAYAGQMHFVDYDLDGNGKFTDSAWGQVDGVYFGEIDGSGNWMPNGQCRYLASASWDAIDYPVITDLTASYGGTKDNIQIQWTAPQNAPRYNQYRICVDGAGCLDVAAAMSPGGTETRYVGVSWYSGNHTISVQPLRDGTVAAIPTTVDVDTNGHAELAPVSGIDFGLVGYNSYLDRAVTINNTSTLVDLVINETTLPMDCTGKVTIISGTVTPGSGLAVDPGAFHAVTLRYAPTETSTCTDGQFRAQWIVTDDGANKTYDEDTLPVTGSSENTPPVITEAYFSPNPVKNADNASVIRVYFEDDNGVCNGIGTDIVEAVWDMRELGGGPRDEMWNSSCATDTHQFWFWKSIDVSTLGNGIYVIPITVTDSAGHTAKTNASFAVYSGNILEVGDGKTYSTISAAVNAVNSGDVVTVYPGTYTDSDIKPNGKAFSIYGIEGPDNTVIDLNGTSSQPIFNIDSDTGNLYIGGFSVRETTNGALWIGSGPNLQKVTVTDCAFEDNVKNTMGGALYAYGDKVDLTLTHSIFRGNSAPGHPGGAVYAASGAKMFFVNVLFDDNSGLVGGALATNAAGPLTFIRCTFTGNEGTAQGGALNISSANGSIEMNNCVVSQNTSGGHGGAIFLEDAAALPPMMKIYNSTIAENTAVNDGGGIIVMKGSIEMKDSILFFNTAGVGLTSQLTIYDDGSAPPEVSSAVVQNCAIGGGTDPISDTGTRINAPNGFIAGQQGNITNDPHFVGDSMSTNILKYRLDVTSPCIDTGSDGSTVPQYDFLGYSRYNVSGKGDDAGAEADMGAFEYQP